MTTTRYYVGSRAGTHARSVFKSDTPPTREAYPQFAPVVGPFRTKRAAILCAVTYPNPHIQTVADAERIARALEASDAIRPVVIPNR